MTLTAQQILTQTAADHDMTVEQMLERSRRLERVRARADAMHRLWVHPLPSGFRRSPAQIARIIGDRDHTCVSRGLKLWEQMSQAIKETRQ